MKKQTKTGYTASKEMIEMLGEDCGMRYGMTNLVYMVCMNDSGDIDSVFQACEASIASLSPREVCQQVNTKNAHRVIIAQNRPYGSMAPSADERNAVDKLASTLKKNGVQVLDHLIIPGLPIGTTDYYSFREAGLLKGED